MKTIKTTLFTSLILFCMSLSLWTSMPVETKDVSYQDIKEYTKETEYEAICEDTDNEIEAVTEQPEQTAETKESYVEVIPYVEYTNVMVEDTSVATVNEEDLASLQQQYTDLQNQIEEDQRLIDEKSEQLFNLQNTDTSLQEEVDVCEQEIINVQTEVQQPSLSEEESIEVDEKQSEQALASQKVVTGSTESLVTQTEASELEAQIATLQEEINFLQAEIASLQTQKEAIEAQINETQALLDESEDAKEQISTGALGFYESVLNDENESEERKEDAQNAIDVINEHLSSLADENPSGVSDTKTYYSTTLEDEKDATSLENMLSAYDYLVYCNELREEEGYTDYRILLYTMAAAQVQSNGSAVSYGHTKFETVGENLIYSEDVEDPETVYKWWYWDEKKVYNSDEYQTAKEEYTNARQAYNDAKAAGADSDTLNNLYKIYYQKYKVYNSFNVGHYINLKADTTTPDSCFYATGLALNENTSCRSNWDFNINQTFRVSYITSEYDASYTVDEYFNKLNTYVNTLQNSANQYDDLLSKKEQLETYLNQIKNMITGKASDKAFKENELASLKKEAERILSKISEYNTQNNIVIPYKDVDPVITNQTTLKKNVKLNKDPDKTNKDTSLTIEDSSKIDVHNEFNMTYLYIGIIVIVLMIGIVIIKRRNAQKN